MYKVLEATFAFSAAVFLIMALKAVLKTPYSEMGANEFLVLGLVFMLFSAIFKNFADSSARDKFLKNNE